MAMPDDSKPRRKRKPTKRNPPGDREPQRIEPVIDSLGRRNYGSPNRKGAWVIPLDEKRVRELAATGATDEEIATLCGCSVDTLTNRCRLSLDEGRANRKVSHRRRRDEIAFQDRDLKAAGNMAQFIAEREFGMVVPEAPQSAVNDLVALAAGIPLAQLLELANVRRQGAGLEPLVIEALPGEAGAASGGSQARLPEAVVGPLLDKSGTPEVEDAQNQ